MCIRGTGYAPHGASRKLSDRTGPRDGTELLLCFYSVRSYNSGGLGYSCQVGLGAVFLAGFIFLILSFWGFREKVMEAIPDALKGRIVVGIGLPIALVGLKWSGLVVDPRERWSE